MNGEPARASKEMRAGDRILWRDPLLRYEEEARVLEVPLRPVSRAESRGYVERLARRELKAPWEEGP